jgi:hypothetical protein
MFVWYYYNIKHVVEIIYRYTHTHTHTHMYIVCIRNLDTNKER